MTEFQRRIVLVFPSFPNGMASTWAIAQKAFPEKWEKRASRGALIAQIKRAGYELAKAGEITCVLPAKHQFDEAILCSN